MATLNINNTDNQVTAVNANQSIIVTDNGSTTQTSITVTQPVTSVILVNTPGPQGPSGGGGGNINTSSFATTGSNIFIGDQFITGSLNANSQIYEVSFLQKDSPPYSSGDNLIELDQDLITNSNYTRNTNTITVNSSGLYRIYVQCRIDTSLSTEAELAVFINNSPYRTYYINNIKSTEISTYDFSCIANLNTNDFIEFHINAPQSGFILYALSKVYNGVINSYMTIEKLN